MDVPMRDRVRAIVMFVVLASVTAVAMPVPVAGQARAGATRPVPAGQAARKTAPGKAYVAPRTPDGQPDLQGIWDIASITPLERPKELGLKSSYTEAEIAALAQQRRAELDRDRRDGGAGADLARAYNEGWYDRGDHFGRNRRTSRLIDPPDGRFPPFTPEAQKKYDEFHRWFAANPGNAAEDRTLFDRCLVFSQSGPPLVPGNYNNLYQIIQTPGYVTIFSEMGHQTRTVPVTPRALLPAHVTQWMGDSVGHWDGDTLVIESRNVRFNDHSHFGTQYDGMTDEHLRITERFTRTAPDLLIYQATVVDPTVYTRPWTIELPMDKSEGPIYEYACHEGNYGLTGILSGERAREKQAGATGK